ncbi:hypothetical protein ACQP2K_25985 [Microbispora siamensis]
MAFEEARYVREVLEPARQSGVLPEDLRLRYQLRDVANPAEVAENVRRVRECWRRSRGLLKFRKLVDKLEIEHAERYKAVFQAAAEGDLGPLRAEISAAGERDRQRLGEARRRLDDAAGRLRLLPPDLVRTIAVSAGIESERAAELAADLGIEIREPERLPQSPPYATYARVREALDSLGTGHLARFLSGDQGSGIRVLGPMPGIADRVAVVERAVQRRPRGPWTIGAETVCSALRAARDPAALVLYDVVTRLRERVREHPYDDTLLRHATDDLGLDAGDARSLVFSIRHETGLLGGPAGRLRELVDRGEIQAAADLVDALPTDALTGEAGELAVEIRARVDKAVRLREEARGEPDPDRAWLLLEDALHRVPDLPGAERLLSTLAPRTPADVTVRVHEGAVLVGWTPSSSRAGEVSYEVYRDGVLIAESPRPGMRDEHPPVNVRLTYAVAARRGQAVSAAVVAPPLVLRPEPRDLRLTAADGVVTGSWAAPPEAVRVVVTRDGVPVATSGSGFRDCGVRNGRAHEYVVRAVYSGDVGEVTTPGLRRTVTPVARPEPLPDFTLETCPGEMDRFLVRCAAPPSGDLEFLLLNDTPPWPYGACLPAAEVRAAGRPLEGAPAPGGHLIRIGPPRGVLLALTVAGDLAAVGAHREHIALPPPRRVTAVRRGGAVYLGLEWPRGVSDIEVSWEGGRLLVGASAYRSQGGIRLDLPEEEAVAVEVASTVVLRGERLRGQPVPVRLGALTPVRYSLRRAGLPLRRELVLELASDRPAVVDRLVLVLKTGLVQPRSASEGRVLGEWHAVRTPARFTLPRPRQPRPYWLRCFAEGGAELVDPPVRTLKVT